ncbi:hypothetical protein [Ramlibacter sp. AN1133]|uniref:hypothetical protein n=1 Tax=Ramlibacter sp. AN1133 TaxID=3133429 RepID=UPI0030C44D11
MKKHLLSIATAALALALAGCANAPKRVADAASSVGERIDTGHQDMRSAALENERRRVASQDVQRPFIAGNSMPVAREVSMPEQLRRNVPVTAMFQRGAVDLDTALRQVSDASGMLITATADALLPAASFAPKTGAGGGAPAVVGGPVRVTLPVSSTPLWVLLDDIARQGSLSWRPVDGGAEFFRVETRVFQLATTPQVANTSASLGRNSSGQIFESTSKTAFTTANQDMLKGLMSTVDALLSVGGRAQLSAESQTLVVVDTTASIARVAKVVEEQNRLMSRRVRVVLEVLEVVDKDQSELGVDWNILYGSASRVLSNASPSTITGQTAGSFSLGPTTGPFAGSNLVVKALNEVGTVVNRRFFPFLTTSGRPVTQAIRSTFNYVDQVQATTPPAGSAVTTAVAPTVTQKEETVGTFVTLVPTAKTDNTIFLSLSFDLTSAQPLVPFTVGSSGSSVTVQQKTIDGTGFIQELPVRSGQTVLVGGLEATTSQDTIRRVGSDAPIILGGSNAAKVTKTRMLLLVTAIAEEGV